MAEPRRLTVFAWGIGLTILFWWPLWWGGGIVGGDTLTYFFPQKTFLADQFSRGHIPFWNNLAGHGYPVLAESQTGICYPPTLLLYSILDVNSAYNANLLLHYVLAFLFTWNYARRLSLQFWGASFVGVVFVYGWFPARIHFEWSILTGAWLPAAFLCVEAYLQDRRRKDLLWLSVVLAMQLLAGHFALAFITLVGLSAYVLLRLLFSGRKAEEEPKGTASKTEAGWIVAAMMLAYLLASVQLIPTWELKRQSHRAAERVYHDIDYGRIPAEYLLQNFAPWHFYSSSYNVNRGASIDAPETNRVEAHLYVGLVPMLFFFGGLFACLGGKLPVLRVWLVIGLLSLLVTPGWLSPLFRQLPGFSYFGGPGRYGILVTFAVAVWSGVAFERLLAKMHFPFQRAVLIVVIFGLTLADLYFVYHAVNPSEILPEPIIHRRLHLSAVRRALHESPEPPRVFAPGQNLLNSIQVAATPNFLGLSPAPYFDPNLKFPGDFSFDNPPESPQPGQIEWLQRAGVTHILTFSPLRTANWPVQPVYFDSQGIDLFLHIAFNRGPTQPMFLYELENSRGRVAWERPSEKKTAAVEEELADRVTLRANSPEGGRLILTDLAYPGWNVTIDGKPATPLVVDEMYRGVDLPAGEHQIVWEYRPASVSLGAAVTACAAILWLVWLLWPKLNRFARSSRAESGANSSDSATAKSG